MNAKKKILALSEYFVPHWTGISKGFHSLVRGLAEDGHAITVLTTRFRSDLPARETIDGIEVIRAEYLLQLSRAQYSPQTILTCAGLARLNDVLLVNSPYSNILPVALTAKLYRKHLSIFHQGDLILPMHEGTPLKKFLLERIFDFCTIGAAWMANQVSCYSEDYASHSRVLKRFLHKFSALIPRVTLPERNPTSTVASTLASLGSRGRRLIGFAGRFVEEKGFDILLKAIPIVLARHPQTHFVFAGETNIYYEDFFTLHQKALDQNRDSLTLLGLLHGSDLREFYEHLELFVLCSRSDCFALTQAEAALCGVPVIVSDIPGARVLVQHTGFGEIVSPSEDSQALANAICLALEKREQYGQFRPRVQEFLDLFDHPSRCIEGA